MSHHVEVIINMIITTKSMKKQFIARKWLNNGSFMLPFICSMPTTVPLFSLRGSESG